MQAILGRGHEAIEQGAVETMKVLQRIEHAELRPQVEMQPSVSDGREVDEHHVAVRLLQGYSGIDGGGRTARASLGAEESKYPGLARAPDAARAGRTEAGESFQQRLGPGGVIQI